MWDGWCGGVSVMPARNPQAALLPAPLEGGELSGRGAARGVSCCAGDELPTGMIWLRHELQLGLHELRCGALGRCGWSADDILIGASPFNSAAECIG